MIVLKLGGSVITAKDEPETLDEGAIEAVTGAIGSAVETGDASDLVVVHGGGSFGHHHAAAHGVSETAGTTDAGAVDAVHGAMSDLNDAVVDAFHREGVPAVPVRPFSAAHRDAEGTLSLEAGQVATMLGEGLVPVLHGDLVAHEGRGATVLSGDEIVVSLARSLGADRVGLCATVRGVLDADGEVIPEIDDYDEVAAALGDSDATDVTGGMAGKVRRLLDLDVPASVFAPEGLAAFLGGDSPGTTIR